MKSIAARSGVSCKKAWRRMPDYPGGAAAGEVVQKKKGPCFGQGPFYVKVMMPVKKILKFFQLGKRYTIPGPHGVPSPDPCARNTGRHARFSVHIRTLKEAHLASSCNFTPLMMVPAGQNHFYLLVITSTTRCFFFFNGESGTNPLCGVWYRTFFPSAY